MPPGATGKTAATSNKTQRKTEKNAFIADLKQTVGPATFKPVPESAIRAPEFQSLQNSLASSTVPPPGRYLCSSQKPQPVTLRGVNSAVTFQVGYGKIIPRWKTGSDVTINYITPQNGYPRPGLALVAANALKEAADEWNKVNLGGLQFQWVDKLEDAAFVLSYAGDQGDVLAEAFFPNEDDISVLNVYAGAFRPGAVQYLKNIFLHELGHVLGFRHEFAPELEDEKDDYSVQVGPRNPLSVMGYEFPPMLQSSDRDSAEAFYRFPGQELGFREAETAATKKKKLLIRDFVVNN